MEESKRRILVCMAHPDDPDFAAAGTVAKWTGEGHEVIYVICTAGDKGSSDPALSGERLAMLRAQEQRAAAQVLGVEECVFLGYPDGGLEDTPQLRGHIVRLLRLHRPHWVVTFDPYRRTHQHRDHRIVGQVTMDAVYPYARDRLHYPEHLEEGLEPHRVLEAYLASSDFSDFWVDISDTFERKVQALLCHASQVDRRPREEFLKGIRERAARAGESQGLALAEAFRRIELRR